MVQLLLNSLQQEPDFEVHHIDARFNETASSIGSISFKKFTLMTQYLYQAIRIRISHGDAALYYIPAPPKTSAIIRDWFIVGMCRLLYSKLILHWHAAGLADWARKNELSPGALPKALASITRFILHGATQSIVLTEFSKKEAAYFSPINLTVIPNGVPDPFPNYEEMIQPIRKKRSQELVSKFKKKYASTPAKCNLLYLSLCIPEKGIFDAIEATQSANKYLSENRIALKFHLDIAGDFPSTHLRSRAEKLTSTTQECFNYHGHITGDDKARLLKDSDVLLFPSTYEYETMGISMVEALASGLQVIAYPWKGASETLKDASANGYTNKKNLESTLIKTIRELSINSGDQQRNIYCNYYQLSDWQNRITNNLRTETVFN